MHASQLKKMYVMLRISNSFVTEAHFAILRWINKTSSNVKDKMSLKILLFLSFKIDHNMAKGAILQRMSPHLKKGSSTPVLQALQRLRKHQPFPLLRSGSKWKKQPGNGWIDDSLTLVQIRTTKKPQHWKALSSSTYLSWRPSLRSLASKKLPHEGEQTLPNLKHRQL